MGSCGRCATERARATPSSLVVDQFEEIFRFRPLADDDGAQASLFVNALLEATQQAGVPIYVVLTMRSDYLGDCARFPRLPEALNDSQYLVPGLTRAERQEAIEGPLRLARRAIAPALVQRLLNDASEDDQLPVLQHALMRTFRRAEGGPLDTAHYERAGTMGSALDQHAEEIYERLPSEAHRELAQRLFRGLTTRESGHTVRRPATLQHLDAIVGAAADSDRQTLVRDVIEAFAAPACSFLVAPVGRLRPGSSIDISHESLMRTWTRLGEWVSAERESADYYRDAGRDAALHEQRDAALWRGPKLAGACRYVDDHSWNEA